MVTSRTSMLTLLFSLLVIFWYLDETGCVTTAINPGLKVRLSQPGLNYAATAAVQALSSKVRGASLPDKSGTANIKVGKVNYKVTNMKITRFNPPSTSVRVNPGRGLTWSLLNAGVSLHGDWSYEYKLGFIKIKDHGNFDADASGLSVSVSVTLDSSPTGQPTIKSTACSSHIGQFKIHVHGGASWLYSLFIKFVEKPVRANIERMICEMGRKAIDIDVARELGTLPLKVPIGPDKQWLLDYRLVSAPSFASGYLESFHKGEFFNAGDPSEAPFQPSSLPSPTSTEKMVTFWMSDYVLNTAGYVLQKRGILRYNLTKKDLPGQHKGLLNTTCCLLCGCIGELVPKIGKTFPNASVEIEMYSSSYPVASVDSSNVTGNMVGIAVLRARLSNNSLARLFTMNVTAKISVSPRLDNGVVKATIGAMDQTIEVMDSSIGPVSTQLLQLAFNVAKKTFILPKLNEAGEKGFPLPKIKHVKFVNLSLVLQSRCISVSTNVQYSPSTLYFNR